MSIPAENERPAVLVVDDEPVVRETAVEAFRALGVEVFETYDGRDALRILSHHPEITLLFTDIRMPGMDGHTLAREVMQMRPQLKVVFVSGWSENRPAAQFRLLMKPWRMDDIATLVKDLDSLLPQSPGAAPGAVCRNLG
jgi:CheY-like chemotaxis protein